MKLLKSLIFLAISASAACADPNDTIACPLTAYLDEPFQIRANTSRVFDAYRIETDAGNIVQFSLFAPKKYDTLTTTVIVRSKWWAWNETYIVIIPVKLEPTVGVGWVRVGVPPGNCKVTMLSRVTATRKTPKVQNGKKMQQLNRSILGRFHAIVR